MASFLEVINVRMQKGEDFVKGRSHCDKCGHILSWWQLIPVISYLILRGKCHYCHCKIRSRYFISEVVLGTLYLLIYINKGVNIMYLGYASILFLTVINDIDTMSVPVVVLRIYAVMSLLFFIINGMNLSDLATALLTGFILIVINVRFKCIGEADIILLGFFTLAFGRKRMIMCVFLSVYLALPYVIFLLIKGKNRKTMIPFCPFIAAGIVTSMLYYREIMWLVRKIL